MFDNVHATNSHIQMHDGILFLNLDVWKDRHRIRTRAVAVEHDEKKDKHVNHYTKCLIDEFLRNSSADSTRNPSLDVCCGYCEFDFCQGKVSLSVCLSIDKKKKKYVFAEEVNFLLDRGKENY